MSYQVELRRQMIVRLGIGLIGLFSLIKPSFAESDFEKAIRPILRTRCQQCHGPEQQEGGLRLDQGTFALKGGDSGTVIVAGQSATSELIRRITSGDKNEMMPPSGERLTAAQIESLRTWIDEGAKWPQTGEEAPLVDPRLDHWAWKPLQQPAVNSTSDSKWPRNEIDRFILAKLEERQLTPSAEADRRTLIRRLSFDLLGLPPTADEIDQFAASEHPQAYEQLVDRYLQSPRYGERWARHWLDVVHYGDTHGYDKDKPRANAWRYRDYVIRALNDDKPYAQFIQEQIAGDALFPDTQDGIEALGFLAAGPWDFIGHAEVPESKIDGKIARHLDRDDMVANTIGTFCSVTISCAQCHNHKFDPFTQEDYYSLQAVFAAIDRTDHQYYANPEHSRTFASLTRNRRDLQARQRQIESDIDQRGGSELAEINRQIKRLSNQSKDKIAPQYGYHSDIAAAQNTAKWVQVDLGQSLAISKIVLRPCWDDFNSIGAGFGFPIQFRIEASDDAAFQDDVKTIARIESDFPNPGLTSQAFASPFAKGRFVRVTATRLAPRQNDYIFALAELQILDDEGRNRALNCAVTSLDSIEASPRWQRANLTDDIYRADDVTQELASLKTSRESLIQRVTTPEMRGELDRIQTSLGTIDAELKKLPPPEVAYIGAIHTGGGTFTGTGANGGKPRPIHILIRGNVANLGKLVGPAAIRSFDTTIPSQFGLPAEYLEKDARAALAKWVSDERNPLTWRSIVNRVWQYHFGQGIVETSNDFGRMGSAPSHPELLDWLAVEFRDQGGSLKKLHRQIVTSASYRQSSSGVNPDGMERDISNRLLWKQNRRKLEAEAVRDAVLAASGKLDLTMSGPGYRDFVMEREAHSPHYQYHLADPMDSSTWRRSIYRFIVRSQTQPFMTSLDCADPSMRVEKRNESISAGQALALLNNGFMVTQADLMAQKILTDEPNQIGDQITQAYRLALGRSPVAAESEALQKFVQEHGLANLCRVIFNLNEFLFVD